MRPVRDLFLSRIFSVIANEAQRSAAISSLNGTSHRLSILREDDVRHSASNDNLIMIDSSIIVFFCKLPLRTRTKFDLRSASYRPTSCICCQLSQTIAGICKLLAKLIVV